MFSLEDSFDSVGDRLQTDEEELQHYLSWALHVSYTAPIKTGVDLVQLWGQSLWHSPASPNEQSGCAPLPPSFCAKKFKFSTENSIVTTGRCLLTSFALQNIYCARSYTFDETRLNRTGDVYGEDYLEK